MLLENQHLKIIIGITKIMIICKLKNLLIKTLTSLNFLKQILIEHKILKMINNHNFKFNNR